MQALVGAPLTKMEPPMTTTTAERAFTALAVGLLFVTALLDPVYSLSIASMLIMAYAVVAYRTRAR